MELVGIPICFQVAFGVRLCLLVWNVIPGRTVETSGPQQTQTEKGSGACDTVGRACEAADCEMLSI